MTESEPLQRWHAFNYWVEELDEKWDWPTRTKMYNAFKAGWNEGRK